MIYSRLLYTEHEQPHNDDGEGAYTIFLHSNCSALTAFHLGTRVFRNLLCFGKGNPIRG